MRSARRRVRLVRLVSVLVVMLCLPRAGAAVESRRVIERRFDLAPGGRVAVDNVFGRIHLVGSSGRQVRIAVVETISAADEAALGRARDEVELEIRESESGLDLYVDGPFRDCDERRRWRRLGYEIRHDFEIEVPTDAGFELSTVTDGDIVVDGVRGDFSVHNVNGAIDMRGLAGAGSAETVNGDVRLAFESSPREACRFETVNGDIESSFPADLSADVELTTRWGEMWSEFEVVALPVAPVRRREEGGRTILTTAPPRLRIGNGGPQIELETLNGDILIRRHRR